MFEMVGRPPEGRTFSGSRRVRLGDCSPGGRLRLDAVARYLQDLSDDDTRDAGLAQMTWVVRRTVVDVHEFPTYLEPLDMVTWCSGIGSRWAERRVDIRSAGGGGGGSGSGGSISSATLWVHLHPVSLRPTPPADAFMQTFAASTGGRSISSRLTLDAPPPGLQLTPWSLRFTDFDVMDHVNNAIALVLVEDVLARRRDLRAPLRIEVEYRSPIDRGVHLGVGGIDGGDGDDDDDDGDDGDGDDGDVHTGWLVDEGEVQCRVAFRIGRPPNSVTLPDPPVA